MTFLDTLDVGGQQYKVNSSIPMGTCATPAGTEVKECAFADSFQLSAGNLIAVTFTYANTYGDGSTTYPKLLVQGVQYPIKIPTGTYAGDGAWVNGQAITFMFDGTNLLMTTTPVTDVIASGNMYSVTSGAVYNAISNVVVFQGIGFRLRVNNKIVHLDVYVRITSETIRVYILSETIPQQYRPLNEIRNVFVNNSNDTPYGQCIVTTNGEIKLYKANVGAFDEADYVVSTDWILA
jgi:uncharacterized membrane protein